MKIAAICEGYCEAENINQVLKKLKIYCSETNIFSPSIADNKFNKIGIRNCKGDGTVIREIIELSEYLINDLKYDYVIGWFDGEDNCIKELVDAIKKEINAAILSKLILCISVKKIENFYLSDIEAFKSIILDPKNANDKSQTIITNFIAENNIEILREENCLDCYNFLGKYSDLYKSVNGSNKKFDKRTSAQKFFTNFKPENCIGSKSFSRMMDRLKNKIV